MKKIIVLALVVLFVACTVAAYAADTSGAKKSGWQSVYDDISSWGKGSAKSTATTTKTTTTTKTAPVKRGTEPTIK